MNADRLIAFTQALVQYPSPPGQEGPVVERVVQEMHTLGYDKVWIDSHGTAIGLMEGARSGPTLLFDGHCDTVGIAPGVPWQDDPFSGKIEEGAIYGRGSADMKGALAAFVYAAASVDRTRLAGRIVVSASVLEEVFEGGALRVVMDELKPDLVIIGEATDLNLNRGGRGRAEIQLETIGRPSHSSAPHQGRNAVLDMMQVIEAIESMALPTHPLLGPAIMALTDIISEPYPGHSVIPSRCRVTYDRRLLSGETAAGVLRNISGLPDLAGIKLNARLTDGKHETYTGASVRGVKFFPAWVFPESEPFVQQTLQGLRSAGLSPKIGAYRFCTNAAYSAGVAGVPTVGFGPAAEADAHIVDERLKVRDLIAAAAGYQGIIEATLGA